MYTVFKIDVSLIYQTQKTGTATGPIADKWRNEMKQYNEVLNLSLEAQNEYSNSALDAAKAQSKQYAEESGEPLNEYLLRDYDANPEGWNSVFQYAYDEISSGAKAERRNVLERALSF